VIHRLGVVPAGEAAIYVGLAGQHRAEAFALLAQFMDRLKQDVPIWKRRALAQQMPEAGRADLSPPPVGVPELKRPTPPTPPASAEEVRALLARICRPLDTERVPLAAAAGRVLREPVRAPEDQPPFDRSAVDGYAVRLDDPGPQFRVVDEIRAGDWKPRPLRPGEAVRIATGGALPDDGLQVVMKEDVRAAGDTLTVLRRDADRNIRRRGEDARAGAELLAPGAVLTPGALALLASSGCVSPAVTRLPRVLHVATGNEIVPPDQTPARGQIRDSNSTLVRAFLASWGIAPEQLRVDEDELLSRPEICPPGGEPDLLLISGGASVGEHDFTRRWLEVAGFTLHVTRTTARPGKPLLVAQRGRTLAFGLPGNPLAHFVCLHLYVRAALEAWSGRAERTDFAPGVLAADLAGEAHARETFWPARWHLQDGAAMLTPLRWRSSGDLTPLAAANALLRVPPGAAGLTRGSRVEFLRTECGS
jgi:molybdopterin molybdotransferase